MKFTHKAFLLCTGLILGTVVFVDSQRTNAQYAPTRQDKELFDSMSKGIEQFSLTLLLRMALDHGETNFVISPLSVWTMLTVLSEGAFGETLMELKNVLRLPIDRNGFGPVYKLIERAFIVNTSTVELASTNRFFVDRKYTLNPQFLEVLRRDYATDVSSIDFKDRNAAAAINSNIRTDTRGKISELVTQDDLADAAMILTNAVFFKGQWAFPFNTSLTKIEPFYNYQNQQTGTVNMMYQRGPFPYVNMQKFQSHVVELPYGKAGCTNFVEDTPGCSDEENRLSMIVMIPYYLMSLGDIFKKFTMVEMKEVIKALEDAAAEYEDDEVDVYLPRFNIDSDVVLNQVLNNMGIYDVFDNNYSDLRNIATNARLYLSRVVHKARIEVNEEGTVATAVTAGELANRNTPPKVVANKPFLYFIYEKKTRIIVFGGTYKKPSVI